VGNVSTSHWLTPTSPGNRNGTRRAQRS
jgi:hypothetical protein